MTRRWIAGGGVASLVWLFPLPGIPSADAQSPPAPDRRFRTGEDLPVLEHRLDNGMRFLILERPGAPTISFVTLFQVGSVNESAGSTGIAHFLEHLLFMGTTTVGTRNLEDERALFQIMDALQDSILLLKARKDERSPGGIEALEDSIRSLEESAGAFAVSNEFDRILSENGARGLNATTSSEETTYFVELPANRARLWFVLEADRMRNPVFRSFYAERKVVAEERRMRVETNPAGLLQEKHFSTAFRVHPYGAPVIGHMEDIQSLTRRQVESFHRRYYGPNNAVVAVVGELNPDSIVAWAEAYFAAIPPGEPPSPIPLREPAQTAERRARVVLDAEPSIRIGWRIGSQRDADAPALQMLASILTGGRASRLHRRLVLKDRVATFVAASVGPGSRYPGLFLIDADPLAPHTTEEIEASIQEELDELRASPPRPEEVARFGNDLEASRIRRLTSNQALALQLAESASAFGDWRETFRLTDRLLTVTPEDVRRVVLRYFDRENRTVVTLVKRGGNGK